MLALQSSHTHVSIHGVRIVPAQCVNVLGTGQGGTTLFKGFAKRLQRDMKRLVDARLKSLVRPPLFSQWCTPHHAVLTAEGVC